MPSSADPAPLPWHQNDHHQFYLWLSRSSSRSSIYTCHFSKLTEISKTTISLWNLFLVYKDTIKLDFSIPFAQFRTFALLLKLYVLFSSPVSSSVLVFPPSSPVVCSQRPLFCLLLSADRPGILSCTQHPRVSRSTQPSVAGLEPNLLAEFTTVAQRQANAIRVACRLRLFSGMKRNTSNSRCRVITAYLRMNYFNGWCALN